MSLLGLMGGHRVGKTTLANAWAERTGAIFMETSVSDIFAELGLRPADALDFTTRLSVQEIILARLDALYGSLHPMIPGVTDRTPLDLLAYTMAEAIGNRVSEADQERFAVYTRRCFEVTNRRFSTIVLVQPGVPLQPAAGKAALNVAYIEHLNSLMLGLSVDQRVQCSNYYIQRQLIDLDSRLNALRSATKQSVRRQELQANTYMGQGGFLQ